MMLTIGPCFRVPFCRGTHEFNFIQPPLIFIDVFGWNIVGGFLVVSLCVVMNLVRSLAASGRRPLSLLIVNHCLNTLF